MHYSVRYESPIGRYVIICDNECITGVWSEEQFDVAGIETETLNSAAENLLLKSAADWLDRYFKGEKPEIGELELKTEGTPFQKTVWNMLMEIPYGETVSYGDIAGRIAELRGIKKMSAQAVGGAVGRNPISVIIPCHRVIGSDGKMVGYGGGLDKKIWLLEHEKTAKK